MKKLLKFIVIIIHHFVYRYFILIIIENNNVFSFGCNSYDELGDGSHTSKNKPKLIPSFENKSIIKLITGGYHTFALSSIINI